MKVLTAQGEVPLLSNAPTDPFALFSESIEDLLLEAGNFLDGAPIENEEQETAVASILTRLRREAGGADEARKAEKKPHDEAAKAIQTKWTPLLKKAELAVETAKSALGAFLHKKEEARRAAVEAARQEADRQATAARNAAQQASPADLAGQTTARVLQENAVAAEKAATRLGKQKVQARGGERAISLRQGWIGEIEDPVLFARWVWNNRKGEMLTWLEALAQREARGGPRNIPGLKVTEDRKAA